jgi:predicted acylesterase/phospholipase RssA
MNDECRRGLVLGGGAALGAYQAGALKAIREHGIEFEVISATSIGTLHALAWNIDGLLLAIDDHWRTNVAGLKPFQPRQLLRAKNPFQFRGALDQVFDTYRPDYPELEETVEILVTLAEFETARGVVFSTLQPGITQAERELFAKASTVLPVLGIPPIKIGDRHYYDGGFFDDLPVRPLLGRGLDEIWIIPLSPVKGVDRALPAEDNRVDAPSTAAGRYLRPLSSLMRKWLRPRQISVERERAVIVAPETGAQARRIFRTSHALTFSLGNIERLLARGYGDGERICRDYLVTDR